MIELFLPHLLRILSPLILAKKWTFFENLLFYIDENTVTIHGIKGTEAYF